MTSYRSSWLALCCLALAIPLARAEDWPGFRGPGGGGNSVEKGLPLTWGGKENENILWSAELHGEGIASPIVWKDRVFLLNASRKDDDKKAGRKSPEQYLACYETKQGKLLWNTPVPAGPWKRGHSGRVGGGYASCTPVTDGERVYGLFGTSVLAALDYSGKIVWSKELTPHRYDMEMATSPILFEDTVIVYCGMQGGSRLVAFDRKTGDTAWDKNLKDTGYGHNTPLLVQVKGKPLMVLMGAGLGPAKNAIQGFDPRTGERLWWCAGKGETASPVLAKESVFCDCGRGGPAKMIDPSGTGDVTKTHVKWEAEIPSGLSSPLVVGDHVYRLHDSKVLTCWELESGRRVYQERVNQVSSPWASPVADGDGNIYLASAGTSLVVKAGPKFEILATNKLTDSNHASPAIAGGRIYLAGTKRLYAIGKAVGRQDTAPAKRAGAESVVAAVLADAARKVRVVIIDGQHNHAWRVTTPYLKRSLERSGRFAVDVSSNLKKGDKAGLVKTVAFPPDLGNYDVVVSNYNGAAWPKEFKTDFEKRLREGKVGFVLFHAANNCFADWPEFNRMVGMAWRNNKFGDRIYYDGDGKLVRVPKGEGPGTGETYHPFAVNLREPEHPIVKGMPKQWMHARDQLMFSLRGPIKDVAVLASSPCPKTKADEPILWTVAYEKGRVVHTPMGHDTAAMSCVGFITTMRRSTEWAATGKVTIPIPADFPSADKAKLSPDDKK